MIREKAAAVAEVVEVFPFFITQLINFFIGFGRGRDGKGAKRGPIEEEWTPVTKLGRLVAQGLVEKIEEIYRFSLPIKG